MRSFEQLRLIKNQRPFVPFYIHLADGRQLRVKHPDAVAWDEDRARLVVLTHDGGFEFVDLALITGLRTPHPEEATPPG